MKKGQNFPMLVMTIILIVVCSIGSAQNGFHVGISAGVQNTLLWSEGRSEIDVRNAFCPLITADIEYRVEPIFGIQSGIGYSLYSQNTSKFRNNFNYLIVPLYLKLGGFKKENKKFALSFLAGPNFKFLISANNVYQDDKNNISEYTTNFHLDYTLGIGLKYKLDDNFLLESHLTGTILGGSFNNASFDGFVLENFNYGLVIGFKYHFGRK